MNGTRIICSQTSRFPRIEIGTCLSVVWRMISAIGDRQTSLANCTTAHRVLQVAVKGFAIVASIDREHTAIIYMAERHLLASPSSVKKSYSSRRIDLKTSRGLTCTRLLDASTRRTLNEHGRKMLPVSLWLGKKSETNVYVCRNGLYCSPMETNNVYGPKKVASPTLMH